jgi:hypothetical protein
VAEVPWSGGAVAEDGDRRRLGRPEAAQHAAQLLRLMVGLGRDAGEDKLLVVVVADLRDNYLKGTGLVAAHRTDVATVDRERDRLRRGRRRGPWRRQRLAFQPGADL